MALVGVFKEDLDIYLAESKGRTGASKQSIKDIPKVSAQADGVLSPGKMYCFNYLSMLCFKLFFCFWQGNWTNTS
mgnify:CR=1 FL=1